MIRPRRTRPEVQDDEDGPGLNEEDVAAEEAVNAARPGRRQNQSGPRPQRPDLTAFDVAGEAYAGSAPERVWAVRDKLAMHKAYLFASTSGASKTNEMLMAAHAFAMGPRGRAISHYHGGAIEAEGPAVLVTSQDDRADIHRRLEAAGLPRPDPSRMIVYPLIDAGGPMVLFRENKNGEYETTEDFNWLREQLSRIQGLIYVGFDPLSDFCGIPIDKDPLAGNFVGSRMIRLAGELGCTAEVSHHFYKAGGGRLENRYAARQAVRGAAALVDAFRGTYTLYLPPEAEAKNICEALGLREPDAFERVLKGATVQHNDAPDFGTEQFYLRNVGRWGIIDRTADVTAALQSAGGRAQDVGLNRAIIRAVRERAAADNHLTRTGDSGLEENLHLLGELSEIPGRADVRRAVSALLDQGRLHTARVTRTDARGRTIPVMGLVAAEDPPGVAAMPVENVVSFDPSRVRTRTPRGETTDG